ncbi:hypothetical protein DSO57_1009505 [Entomophthora muscae]|uniref:Uncharacterized protein n=1 Tax=Entomophthora muscae TaxID=34485 RepID=A0ACC2URJ7_9FUNG|nr:hypothetical protein DSO57_1009505 [Entomophthora muscae]
MPRRPPHIPTNSPDADKDQATLDSEEKVSLRALGPHICIMDFNPAQFNAFEQLFSRELQGCHFHFCQAVAQIVRNDNSDAPKSQNTEPESNPGQNPSRNARLMGWKPNKPLLIDKVVTSPPGPEPLAVLQDSASEPPVQDAENFPEVPTPDTGSFLGEIRKFLHESYSKLPPKSQGRH